MLPLLRETGPHASWPMTCGFSHGMVSAQQYPMRMYHCDSYPMRLGVFCDKLSTPCNDEPNVSPGAGCVCNTVRAPEDDVSDMPPENAVIAATLPVGEGRDRVSLPAGPGIGPETTPSVSIARGAVRAELPRLSAEHMWDELAKSEKPSNCI